MSYARPTSTAANFSFLGASAYTRSASNAADFSFLTGNTASGFTSTVFGVPNISGFASGFISTAFGAATVRVTQSASGFVTTELPVPSIPLLADSIGIALQLGVPTSALTQRPEPISSTSFGFPLVKPSAVGFLATNVSIPSIPLRAEGIVPTLALGVPEGRLFQQVFGIGTTAFGTPQNMPIAVGFGPALLGDPSGSQFWRAGSLGLATRFSLAYFAFPQALDASSFTVSKFGNPIGLRFTTSFTDQLCQAFGFTGSFVSTPTASSLQIGGATGFAGTQLPVPDAVLTQGASAFSLVFFGVPSVNFFTYSSGLVQTQFGLPTLQLTQAATNYIQKTRFGSPASSRSRTYTTYGIYRGGRVGHPSGFVRINRTAAGFCSSVSGAPAALFRNHVAHLAPGTNFGAARLTRGITC